MPKPLKLTLGTGLAILALALSSSACSNKESNTGVSISPSAPTATITSEESLQQKYRQLLDEATKYDLSQHCTSNKYAQSNVLRIANCDKRPVLHPSEIERLIHEYTNEIRAQQGLPTLSDDPALADIARTHSTDMIRGQYFGHTGSDGNGLEGRVSAANYSCAPGINKVAENLAVTPVYSTVIFNDDGSVNLEWDTTEDLAKHVVDGLMNSPNHRKNMLSKDSQFEGVGIATGSNGLVYATVDFCGPKN